MTADARNITYVTCDREFTDEELQEIVTLFQKAEIDPLARWRIVPKRRIYHIVAGDDNWTPTTDELQSLVQIFQEANLENRGDTIISTSSMVHIGSPIRVDVLDLEGDVSFVGNYAIPSELKAGVEWKHEDGEIYTVVTVSNLNSTRPDFTPTVVFRGPDGAVWSRPVSEFVAKCEPLPLPDEDEDE